MEKYLLTSQNFSGANRQAQGTVDFFQKIRKISSYENVFIEAEIPDLEIILNWEEFKRPLSRYSAFMPLLSPKLYAYNFQYLGSFEKNKSAIIFGNSVDRNFSEHFSAKLNGESVFSFEDACSNQCNLTWVLDFLMNSEKISSDRLRDERLIWQKSLKGYELVLESVTFDKKITEREVFYFQNNFESVSWQHLINIR
jgi:hypothetical protein